MVVHTVTYKFDRPEKKKREYYTLKKKITMQESNMKKREKNKYPEWVTCRKRYKSMLCFQQKS